jgi:methyl-accepting chemotaxis protein
MSSEDTTDSDGSNPVMGVVRTVTPEFIRKRFALKFVIVLLFMGIAIVAMGAYGTAQITSETEDRIQNEYSGLAVQEQNVVDQWIERNRISTRLMSSDSHTWEGNDSVAISESAQNRREETGASAVYIFEGLGANAEVVGGTQSQPGTRMAELDQRWAITRDYGPDSQVQVSTVYVTDSGPVVGFVSPVPDSNRYVLVESSVRDMTTRFRGQERASGGFTLLVNQSGTVLIDERRSNATAESDLTLSQYGSGGAREPIDRADELSQEPSGVIDEMPASAGIIDEPYTVGYAPVIVSNGPNDWAILVHAPRSEVFGFAQTISTFGLLTTGAAALLIVLIGAVLGYNTSTSINRLRDRAERMEEGDLDVDIDSPRIDAIGRLYDGFAEMRDALREQIQEAEQARKEAEVSRAEAMEMNNYLQEKAEEYSETMQACSRGDLTRRMEPEGENDAMDQIAEDFNDMIGELEMTTGQLKTFAVEVEEGGRGVQQSAETVRDASEQVADSVQKISDDAYDQKERLQTISEEMDAIASQLEDFAEENPDVDFGDSLETIRQIAEMVGDAVELGEETMAESENVAGAAEEQAAELNEVSSRAEELVRYAQYLGDGLSNFETEEEHEFVFQTGAGSTGPAGDEPSEPTDSTTGEDGDE